MGVVVTYFYFKYKNLYSNMSVNAKTVLMKFYIL